MEAKLREAKEAQAKAKAEAAAKAVLDAARKAAAGASVLKTQLAAQIAKYTKQIADAEKAGDLQLVRKAKVVLANLNKQAKLQAEADKKAAAELEKKKAAEKKRRADAAAKKLKEDKERKEAAAKRKRDAEMARELAQEAAEKAAEEIARAAMAKKSGGMKELLAQLKHYENMMDSETDEDKKLELLDSLLTIEEALAKAKEEEAEEKAKIAKLDAAKAKKAKAKKDAEERAKKAREATAKKRAGNVETMKKDLKKWRDELIKQDKVVDKQREALTDPDDYDKYPAAL